MDLFFRFIVQQCFNSCAGARFHAIRLMFPDTREEIPFTLPLPCPVPSSVAAISPLITVTGHSDRQIAGRGAPAPSGGSGSGRCACAFAVGACCCARRLLRPSRDREGVMKKAVTVTQSCLLIRDMACHAS